MPEAPPVEIKWWASVENPEWSLPEPGGSLSPWWLPNLLKPSSSKALQNMMVVLCVSSANYRGK